MKRIVIALFICTTVAQPAEPDWPQVEQHAIELLQQYVRIASVDPPADTRATAALFQAELERNGLKPVLYTSGPNGQTDLVVA